MPGASWLWRKCRPIPPLDLYQEGVIDTSGNHSGRPKAAGHILTLTPNPALDRVIFIDEFVPGGVMRASNLVHSVGGKSLDASVVLATLGAPQVALCFQAGAIGRQVAALLDSYGVPYDIVWTDGETRIAHVLAETYHHRHSHIMTGRLAISPEQQTALLDRCLDHLAGASWLVTGGSLPPDLAPDFYATVVALATQAGVSSLVDAPGPPVLTMLQRVRPTILKMNRAELWETFGVRAPDVPGLAAGARRLLAERGLINLVLTCGADGLLALTPDATYWAGSPPQQEVNAAGAGDAVSGTLPYRLSLGDPWPDALRWAAAASAAVVITPGTADCCQADIDRILPDTWVQRLP